MATCSELVIQHLQDYGPATLPELERAIPYVRRTIVSALHDLRLNRVTIPRMIHIQSYIKEDEVKQRYTRAVYALGDKPDAKYPKRDSGTARTKRWREKQVLRTRNKKKSVTVANSVFNWRP
jgi:hypothetical protein